jgi:hypothetical protein
MRLVLAVLITGAIVAAAGVVSAKPNGYIGPGRPTGSNIAHIERKNKAGTIFKQTFTKPFVAPKAPSPNKPLRPKSTVGFTVSPP